MSYPYRQDRPMPIDTKLQKWNEIGQLVHSAIQAVHLSRRVHLVFQILSLINDEEKKAIGILDWWPDSFVYGFDATTGIEKAISTVDQYNAKGWPQTFYDVDGKEISEEKWRRDNYKLYFKIEQSCGKVLRLVCEFCESKGVRISRGVEAEGPRGHVIGVSRIVGERVEVETRKETSEGSESETAESEASENQAEQ